MADKPLVKWFIRIVSVIMILNMVLVAVSACIVPFMDTVVFSCSGEDACILQLDFKNRQVRYMKYASAYENRWMVGEMTDFMAVRLKFAAAVAAAPLWFGSYSGGDEAEADAWSMDMYFGRKARSCRGNGGAPLSYKIFESKIMAIAEMFPEDLPQESQQIPGNVATADI